MYIDIDISIAIYTIISVYSRLGEVQVGCQPANLHVLSASTDHIPSPLPF